MCYYHVLLDNCPPEFKPVFYRRYVDDIFVMLSPDHLNLFEEYMNTCHSSISFTSETELENVMTFLDFEFNRKNNEFVSTVYRKATFTGVYTHFESLIPLNYKRGFVSTLIYLIFHICSSFEIIVKELNNFK